MPLDPYLAQVHLAARYSRWGDNEAAVHLALAMEGPAVQVLLYLAPVDWTSLEGLITVLEIRFGQYQSVNESREHQASYRQNGEAPLLQMCGCTPNAATPAVIHLF